MNEGSYPGLQRGKGNDEAIEAIIQPKHTIVNELISSKGTRGRERKRRKREKGGDDGEERYKASPGTMVSQLRKLRLPLTMSSIWKRVKITPETVL